MSRGQLAGRLCSHINGVPCYAIAGILEVPKGSLKDEVVFPFMCASGDEFDGFLAMSPREVDDYYPHEADDLGSLVTRPIWTSPGSGFNGGSIYVRRTRMPASAEHEILAFAGVLVFSGKPLDELSIYEMASTSRLGFLNSFGGESGMDVVAKIPCIELNKMKGNAFAQLLKLPIWGFSDEKVGFRSTMRLDVIDECEELSRLLADGETTVTSKRAAILDAGYAGEIVGSRSVGAKDEKFSRFLEIMRERGSPPRWDAVMTQTELDHLDVVARDAMREVLNQETLSFPQA